MRKEIELKERNEEGNRMKERNEKGNRMKKIKWEGERKKILTESQRGRQRERESKKEERALVTFSPVCRLSWFLSFCLDMHGWPQNLQVNCKIKHDILLHNLNTLKKDYSPYRASCRCTGRQTDWHQQPYF